MPLTLPVTSKKRIAWNKGLPAPWALGEKNVNWKGGQWCVDCGNRVPNVRKRDPETIRCKPCAGKFYRGENSWNWKGGISKYNRMSYEYIKWAKSVYAKDHYTCAMCHKHCTKDIQAHHILSWKDAPELRLEVNNGITLCFDCHLTTRGKESYFAPLFYNVLATRQSDRFVWSN